MDACQTGEVAAALAAVHWDVSAEVVERESFRRIEAEMASIYEACLPARRIIRRLIHTTGDLSIGEWVRLRHDPVQAGLAALRGGAPLFCDAEMVRAGLSLRRLRAVHAGYTREHILCYINDPDVMARATREGWTRALCAVEKARPVLDGAVVLIGNAPLALARVARYILEDGVRPALVVGMPVGFVNVVEAKRLLALCPTPHIVLEGRRGGSALAVAALHAVLESA